MAPDFALPDQTGRLVCLRPPVTPLTAVYFYPAAATPGCTLQACAVRDHQADLQAAGVRVIGVSADPPGKVAAFAQAERLDFPLLADADGAVCKAYGVWGGSSAARTTFLLDGELRVREVLERVDPATHVQQLLGAIGRV